MPSERFLDLYLAESRDCVRRLTANALALERGDADALTEAFRAAHTLKGIAATIGHLPVAESAHSIEDLLAELRDGKRAVNAVVIDELLKESDAIDAQLSGEIVLDATAAENPASERPTSWNPAPPAVDGAGAVVSVRIAENAPLRAARALTMISDARRRGGVVTVEPDPAGAEFDGEFHVYLETEPAAADLAARWRNAADVELVRAARQAEAPASRPERREWRGGTLRVDRHRLDRLAEGIAELAVHFASPGNGSAGYERAAAVVADLQRTVLELRTVPVNVIHDRAVRVVRDAARALHKEIDLEVAGGEIELDQAVLDAVAEPLLHLLRNAADHGIETPAERERLGKPRRGRIVLGAERDRTSVRITVADDGRGVAKDTVLKAATDRGFDVQDADGDSLLRLLMQPGFTTADSVSGVSGRGVGLDAVGAQVRALGGAIDMVTTKGAGTTFMLRVPFTLAIVHGLRVRVADGEYAMPLTHVAEIALLGDGRVQRKGDREYVRVRDTMVPLMRLRAVLGAEPSGREPAAVVAEVGERRLALAVDEVLEHEPIVIKSFDAPAGTLPVFSGATVRPDGRPVLLLDPLSVV